MHVMLLAACLSMTAVRGRTARPETKGFPPGRGLFRKLLHYRQPELQPCHSRQPSEVTKHQFGQNNNTADAPAPATWCGCMLSHQLPARTITLPIRHRSVLQVSLLTVVSATSPPPKQLQSCHLPKAFGLVNYISKSSPCVAGR